MAVTSIGCDCAPLEELTQRELEVLRLMAGGFSNAAICQQLFLSPKTVESHVGSIYGKLCLSGSPAVHRRVAAVISYLTRSSTATVRAAS